MRGVRGGRVDPRSYSDWEILQLTGFERSRFDWLARELVGPWREFHGELVDRRRVLSRLNARGGGRPGLPFESQLLLALVYLRQGPTFRALAAQFGVGKDVAWRAVDELTAVMGRQGIARPDGTVISSVEELERLIAASVESSGESGAGDTADSDGESDGEGGAGLAGGAGPEGGAGGGPVGAVVIVDGSFTRIRRPKGWEEQKAFYSPHRHLHCLTFQACVDRGGQLLWLSGHSQGATHDLTALADSALAEVLKSTRKAVALDKAYVGIAERLGLHEDHWVIVPFKKPRKGSYSDLQLLHNQAVAQVRVYVEHFNAVLKRWKIMHYFRRRHFRYDETLHAVGFTSTLKYRV